MSDVTFLPDVFAYRFAASGCKDSGSQMPVVSPVVVEKTKAKLGNSVGTDDGDLGIRSRLTYEQLAILEAHFVEKNRPNIEYKKSLAEKIGVEFQVVNVSDLPAYLIFHIDSDRRIGFRIAELKQNIRIHKGGDMMFHQSRRPIKI